MSVSELAKEFFRVIEGQFGPFDRPIQFRPFPFDAGGALNFLTVGAGQKTCVTYISWDLFGHPKQKRGSLGRYEVLALTDDEDWCIDVLTRVGNQCLQDLFKPGDTLDIAQWTSPNAAMQGIIFEEAFKTRLRSGERCGLLRCIGVARQELEFAVRQGVPALIEHLKRNDIYPRSMTHRAPVKLPAL